MFKMMEKKNNDQGELIDRTAWFTRLRLDVLLVLIYKLSVRSCCRVSFSNDQMIPFSEWSKANILNSDNQLS